MIDTTGAAVVPVGTPRAPTPPKEKVKGRGKGRGAKGKNQIMAQIIGQFIFGIMKRFFYGKN